MLGNLEEALSLRRTGNGLWRGHTDPAYEGHTGMYGGYTAALLLKATVSEPYVIGAPSALTVNYVKALPPDSEVEFRTRLLGATRSIQNWTVEVSVMGAAEVSAFASVVMTARREVDGNVQQVMPNVPPPEQVDAVTFASRFGRQFPVRPVMGMNLDTGSELERTHSAQWIREISGRPADAVQIACLCDNYPPRAFFTGKGIRPSSTVTYSVYFVGKPEGTAAVGDNFTLIDVIDTRAIDGTAGSRANLWSCHGVLLATTEQLCW